MQIQLDGKEAEWKDHIIRGVQEKYECEPRQKDNDEPADLRKGGKTAQVTGGINFEI